MSPLPSGTDLEPQTEKQIVKPWRFGSLLVLIACLLLFLVFLALPMEVADDPDASMVETMLSWVPAVFFGLGVLAFLSMLVFKYPRIELAPDGLCFKTPFVRKSWKWSDVGPFCGGVFSSRYRTSYCVCAYTDENHDLLTALGKGPKPTIFDADISIDLSHFSHGLTFGKAEAFAETLNEWRDKYGSPEITYDPVNARERADQLAIHKRRKVAYIFAATCLFCFAVAAVMFLLELDVL
jgi:hypothetical protein